MEMQNLQTSKPFRYIVMHHLWRSKISINQTQGIVSSQKMILSIIFYLNKYQKLLLYILLKIIDCKFLQILEYYKTLQLLIITSFNSHMIYDRQSSAQWSECHKHQQEIAMLQEKLMEIHNKLIDQLDICKEQQLTIIDLNKKLSEVGVNRNTAFDTFKYQSFGQHSDAKENQTPNYRVYHQHDSREYNTKAELLQADLQAMRSKVLTEITEKNKLKEDIKQIRNTHKKELSSQSKKIEGLQGMLRKVQDENGQLRQRLEKARRDYRSDSQLDKMTAKIVELQARYQKQREKCRQITAQNVELVEKLDQLQQQLQQIQHRSKPKQRQRRTAYSDKNFLSPQSEENWLHGMKSTKHADLPEPDYRERPSQRPQYRERPSDRPDDRRKKRGFDETKELIKKLEEAEQNMRKNRRHG